MQEMKQLAEYVKEHPIVIITTALGAVVGAVLGLSPLARMSDL